MAYDAIDHLTSVLDPRSLKTAYAWDGLDDQLQLTSPDTGVTSRTFDAAGNVATSTDARGKKTVYSYDALNCLNGAVYADGTSAVWQYDQGTNGVGRLSKLTDITGSTSYAYDANGHVTQKKQAIGATTLTTAYGYDAGGRLASVTYPSGKQVVYTYDAAGRVASVMANGQTLVKAVTYLPFGMVTGWTAGNGASYQRMVDLDGRITGLALPASDTIALGYDAANRITSLTESGLAAQTFGYDARDRLINYKSGTATQAYTYDPNNNRTSYATNATPPVSLTYNVDKASNRLLGITGSLSESFTYDASGNMLSYSAPFAGYTFSYDARNRQTEAFVGAVRHAWRINGLGQRVAQYGAGDPQFYFAYDESGHLTGKYDAIGNADQQETVWLGDLPIAVLAPSGLFYIAPDHLGAPHQITNASGKVAWLWSHDPFGNGTPSDPLGNFTYDVRFPGQFYDQATHLHYNYFRDYDPRIGRYIESDPIGLKGGINTYTYVGGNPVAIFDKNGLYSDYDFIKNLRANAEPNYTHNCVRYVIQSLRGYDVHLNSGVADATSVGPVLAELNYFPVSLDLNLVGGMSSLQVGDIFVIEKNGVSKHLEAFTGDSFISDTLQKSFNPYGKNMTGYTQYRSNGPYCPCGG